MTTTSQTTGIGFGGLLTVLFVGLKLTGVIEWSWWWVLCPIWVPIVFVTALFGIIMIAESR